MLTPIINNGFSHRCGAIVLELDVLIDGIHYFVGLYVSAVW